MESLPMTDPNPPAPIPIVGSLRLLKDNGFEELSELATEIAELSRKLALKADLYGKLTAQYALATAQGIVTRNEANSQG